MKFLIFNIIVFCALGYLLTSKPNENFNQWVSNTKNKISNISCLDSSKNLEKNSSIFCVLGLKNYSMGPENFSIWGRGRFFWKAPC